MIDETSGCTSGKAGQREVRNTVSIPKVPYDAPQALTKEANARRRDLFRRFAAENDPAIREELVFSHLGMVRQLASRFSNRSETLDDLIQVGIIGLIKA